ncbi:MAG TPA: GNAT family N-acetyltransferase [Mycobacteriales bacterium]|nr:GNAT family N-acetyltransferase [Mycobacteriales bacterium]
MLLPVASDQVEALLSGATAEREVAPGWPHVDTATALSFIRSGGTQFLILDEDGRIAGECGTKTATRHDGSVEIGYGLAGPSRGHGLGSRAVADLMTWLQDQADVSVVEAEVHVSNTASRRIVERLGFVADGAPDGGYLRYRRAVRDGNR